MEDTLAKSGAVSDGRPPDKTGKPVLHVMNGLVLGQVHLFLFESLQEALHQGVIVRIPLAGHADPKVMILQDLDVLALAYCTPPDPSVEGSQVVSIT